MAAVRKLRMRWSQVAFETGPVEQRVSFAVVQQKLRFTLGLSFGACLKETRFVDLKQLVFLRFAAATQAVCILTQ